MDFEFSAEQEDLRASVRRFLAERAPIRWVRQRWDDPTGTTDDVWRGIVELGLTSLLVPTELGGAGAGMVDAGVVLEEMGRVVHPGPYLATAISAAGLLGELVRDEIDGDIVNELLAGIAAGSIVAVGLYEPDRRFDWREPTTVIAGGSRARVHGTKQWVLSGVGAEWFLVVGRDANGELCLAAVRAHEAGVSVEPQPTVDGTRQFAALGFDATPGELVARGPVVERAVACMLDLTAIAMVVDGVGTAEQALHLAVEYAKQRHQFGVPIGSFQAVQHLCADMLRDVEMGRAGAYYGLWAADAAASGQIDPAERHRAATMAKAFASDAFFRVGASAIQVFGGIGFTWEHDAHLYYKRLLTLQHAFGGTREHLDELARLVID